jgi:hypothetical protein
LDRHASQTLASGVVYRSRPPSGKLGNGKGGNTGVKNDRARTVRFVPKESAHGHFWVAAEPAGDTIKSLDDCVLGFDLEPGASHGQAVAVADFLNRNIAAITLR